MIFWYPMNISKDTPIALHIQIAEHFRKAIQQGDIAAGSLLPSELSIAKEYDISRSTVRKAMDILVTEGLVVRQPGKGTFVRTHRDISLDLIGVILPSTRESLSVEIMVGVEQAAKKDGYHVIFTQTNENIEQEARDVESLRKQNVAGFVLFPASGIVDDQVIRQLVADNLPVVLVDRFVKDIQTDAVTADNVSGGYLATEHLIGLGHERIGFVASAPMSTTSVHDRYRGYRAALNKYQKPYDHHLLLESPYPTQALEDFLTQPDHPTAIFASNDYTAVDVINTAKRRYISVPDQLAVVGFDNREAFWEFGIPLTTIAQFPQLVGARAYELLKEQINGTRQEICHEKIPVKLIVRQSSGA